MLIVVCTYTICTLNDKYAVSKAGIGSNEFTFLIAMSTSFFMTAALPFSDRFINFSPMAVVFTGLVAADKLLELQTISKVLKELSAFEVEIIMEGEVYLYFIGVFFWFSPLQDMGKFAGQGLNPHHNDD